jgi:undecaprenyl-diphosphatase
LNWFSGLLLGIVQGLTEFLPVSSSGHLAIAEQWFGMEAVPFYFDVWLHLGTLISVCVMFRKDLAGMLCALPALFQKDAGPEKKRASRLILLLAAGTLPLFLTLPLYGLVRNLGENIYFVGSALIVTAILLFLASRIKPGKLEKDERTAKWGDIIAVGLAQAMAVVPGISRSGATLTTGLFSGFSRSFALRYAFLLSIPAILGAGLVDAVSVVRSAEPVTIPIAASIAGFAASAIVGVCAIKLLRKLASRLHLFAAYCCAVGTLAIVLQMITG